MSFKSYARTPGPTYLAHKYNSQEPEPERPPWRVLSALVLAGVAVLYLISVLLGWM